MVEHYILGIFFKLKLFSVFFFLALFKASIILLFPFLSLFRVLLICEHNFFCFFSCFRYLSELKRLNGISFVISAGSSVAIVGTSGSGKASMILKYILDKYYIKKLPWTVWFFHSFFLLFPLQHSWRMNEWQTRCWRELYNRCLLMPSVYRGYSSFVSFITF